MSFTCLTHNWHDTEQPCPICMTIVTSTTDLATPAEQQGADIEHQIRSKHAKFGNQLKDVVGSFPDLTTPAVPSPGVLDLPQTLKEFDAYFDALSQPQKDAGNLWIAFPDKWRAFKQALAGHASHRSEAVEAYPTTISPPMCGQDEAIGFLEWYELTNYWHDDTVTGGPMVFKNGYRSDRKYTAAELYQLFLTNKK